MHRVSPERLADTLHFARAPDAESLAWLRALASTGTERREAIERLHALLLRAARFEVSRRGGALRGGAGDLDDLALQAADDALLAVLRKLPTYRGASRFTTWAYKFALLEAAVKVRRRAWQGRELPLEEDAWARLPDGGGSPAGDAETSELLDAVRDAIAADLTDHQRSVLVAVALNDVAHDAETSELLDAVRDAIAADLTDHQRSVLVAVALNDVPIDVFAERHDTTRGAVYKTLHDARRKLRSRLAEQGFYPGATPDGGSA